jgi:L-alanine-DL-glutamate epimerase-like enolase superfamily enzyme
MRLFCHFRLFLPAQIIKSCLRSGHSTTSIFIDLSYKRAMKLTIQEHSRPLRTAFAISRGSKTLAHTVTIELEAGGVRGRGECVPYGRYGETCGSVIAEIETCRADIESAITRAQTQTLLPAGAARCALDCALWDLEAKQTGRPVWQLAGLPEPKPLETAITITLDTPENMARAAEAVPGRLLKLKIGGKGDLDRLEAVHAARPDGKLILDGNEGMAEDNLASFLARAADLGVVLIEQPLPADADHILADLSSPVPICADESAHTASNIDALASRYGAVNIKLDKTGGLTEAIAMYHAARSANMKVMIGCMVAGSLSMAPALLLAQLADFVDLDGPLWLSEDVRHGLSYSDGHVTPPGPALWG